MTTQQINIKDEICNVMNQVSFRTFGNAFRKTIDANFKAECHLPYFKNITWSELAGYIIGDGNYYVTMEQYEAFMKEINKNK